MTIDANPLMDVEMGFALGVVVAVLVVLVAFLVLVLVGRKVSLPW